MGYDYLLYERQDGVVTITLNRPDKLNALFGTMREELVHALDTFAGDAEARVGVLTGAGRGFCAGGDIDYMEELQRTDDVKGFAALVNAGREVVLRIRACDKPIIAAINGPAAGAGMNLALACDLRIASEQATFGETFVRLGLHPDWGGTYLLTRLVGAGRAMELMLLGKVIDAQAALRFGIVAKVVTDSELQLETRHLAEALAAAPPISLALIKKNVNAAFARSLDEALAAELDGQLRCFASQDSKEGLRAFREKRKPHYTGT